MYYSQIEIIAARAENLTKETREDQGGVYEDGGAGLAGSPEIALDVVVIKNQDRCHYHFMGERVYWRHGQSHDHCHCLQP